MGYYTKFELAAYDAKTKQPINEDLEAEIARKIWVKLCGSDNYMPRNFEDAVGGDAMKWYDHEEDMYDISLEYPDVIFVLDGEGEEFPDAWRCFTHNGVSETMYAEIHYPDPVNPVFYPYK